MEYRIWWWVLVFAFAMGTVQMIGRVAIAFIQRGKSAPPALPPGVAERLERIEQAVEATALEVERIGEGQRFVTRLLGDGEQARKRAG